MAFSHNKGFKWVKCPYDDCTYKTKAKSNLYKHLAHRHKEIRTIHHCPFPDCEYEAIDTPHLRRHI